MLIEFQMNPASFFALFRNRLRHFPICDPGAFPFDMGACSGPTMLDRVTIKNITSFKNNFDGTLSIHQDIGIRMVSVSALEPANREPAPACFEPTLTAVFIMSIEIGAEGARLCLRFDRFDLVSDPKLNEIEAQINEQFDQQCNAFDLGPLQDLLGESVAVVNGALSLAGDSERIALRLAIADDASAASWSAFRNGDTFPSLASDWSLLLSKHLGNRSINTRLQGALQNAIDADKIKLNAGPTTTYISQYGLPRFRSTFSVEAIDACICFWEDIDVDADITTTATVSVPEPNVLQTDLYMAWDLNDAEVFCCAFTAGLFWLHVGAFMLTEDELDAGFYPLGFLAGPLIVTIIGSAIASGQVSDEIALPATWQEIGKDNNHFRLRQTVNLGGADFGGLTLNSILALPQGPLLGGTLGAVADLATPELRVTVNEFFWDVEDKCIAKDDMRVVASASLGVGWKASSVIGLQVCEMVILEGSDPLGQFSPYFQADGSIIIPYSGLIPEYAANPYPLKVRIVSSGGVRVITIATPTIPTQHEVDAMIQAAFLAQPTRCEEADSAGHPFWKGSRYNPKWGIDPPPDKSRYVQLWDVVISGLAPGERVRVGDRAGKLIGQAQATPRGVAQVSAFLSATRGQEFGMVLNRIDVSPHLATTARQEIALQQTALVDGGRLRMLTNITGIAMGNRGEELAVLTEQGFYLFNLTTPGYARLVRQQPLSDMKGMAAFRGGFLTWGSEGMRAFGVDATVPRQRHIEDAAIHRRFLMLLSDGSLQRFDLNGKPAGSLTVPGASQVAVSRNVVAVSVPPDQSLRFFDALTLSPLGVYKTEVRGVLQAAKIASTAAAFYTGLRTVGITEHNALVEGMHYEQRPWFANSSRAGNVLARISDSGRSIQLYLAARSRGFKR